MNKAFYFSLFLGLVAVFSFALVSSAQAGALTAVTVTPDSSYGGRSINYTVSFVVATQVEATSTVRLIFPTGFDVSGATATSTITASATGATEVATSTVSGQEVTLWLADGGTTPANDTMEFSGVGVIKNPFAGGSKTLGVATLTEITATGIDSASSTAFTISAAGDTGQGADTSAPTSKITSPAEGVSIPAGIDYNIRGTGTDTGSSIVSKVEVSVDDGATWWLAQVNSSAGTYSWEYVWQNPTAGEYTITVRATDAKGNRESAGAGVKVTVSGVVIPIPTPTPTPPPTGGTTIEALQSQVAVLQQQVIALMQKLIQVLTAQL